MKTDVSRRDFLTAMGGLGLMASTAAAQGQPQSPRRMFAYVGSWTSGPGIGVGNGGGLSVFSIDMATGTLTPVMRTGPEFDKFNAGYLAVHPNGRFLYATNEVESYDGEFGGGAVVTFAISPADGSIAPVGTQPSMGVWPAYISIDRTGSRVAVANHGNYDPSVRVVKKNGVPEIEKVWDDGTVALLPVRPDGTLDRPSDVAVLERTTERGQGHAARCSRAFSQLGSQPAHGRRLRQGMRPRVYLSRCGRVSHARRRKDPEDRARHCAATFVLPPAAAVRVRRQRAAVEPLVLPLRCEYGRHQPRADDSDHSR